MKLYDYINSLIDNDNRFITVPLSFTGHEYLAEYSNNKDNWALDLDEYFANKYASLVLINDSPNIIGHIKQGIMQSNFYKWDKLWETMKLTYNPIWNVEGEEVKTTVYGEHTTSATIGERKNNTTERGYTFPYDTETKTQTAENDISNTVNSATDNHTSNAHTDTETLRRSGNIGVTSTQHLINEERQVALFNFWEVVYTDIIRGITIPYWED